MKETEQLRKLKNEVIINGTLATLDVHEGNTKADIPFVSVKGTIKFGESGTEALQFEKFAQKYKADKTESKAYTSLLEWISTAVPMTDSVTDATKLQVRGELVPHDYWSPNHNRVVESVRVKASFFSDYEPPMTGSNGAPIGSQAQVNIEGYIKSIKDEIVKKDDEEVPTGRKEITLVSTDSLKNALVLNRLKVPECYAGALENQYDVGDTATFTVGYTLHRGAPMIKTGGFGNVRFTNGKDYLEMVVEGANPPETEAERIISKKAINALLTDRTAKIDSLKENEGNTTPAPTTTKKATTKKTEKIEEPDFDDDDMAF